MPTAFETLLIVGIAICASHLITAFFENLVATAVLILYLAALIFLVALIITFQWYTTNFAQHAQFARLSAETEKIEQGTRSPCMAQKIHDRKYATASERLWQEEQRRNLEDFRRHQHHTSSTSAMQAAFSRWRQDCRTLLQTPELITNMPQLPCLPCPKGYCNLRSIHTGVCSHRLRKLYETSQLEEKELRDEMRLWQPHGTKTPATMDIIGMMIIAVCIHFFRNPSSGGWLVVVYCLYWDIRGIRSWLMRLAADYMDPAV